MKATFKDKTDTVALLLDRGANIEAKDIVRIQTHTQKLSS
jgi:hypothetical protein